MRKSEKHERTTTARAWRIARSCSGRPPDIFTNLLSPSRVRFHPLSLSLSLPPFHIDSSPVNRRATVQALPLTSAPRRTQSWAGPGSRTTSAGGRAGRVMFSLRLHEIPQWNYTVIVRILRKFQPSRIVLGDWNSKAARFINPKCLRVEFKKIIAEFARHSH